MSEEKEEQVLENMQLVDFGEAKKKKKKKKKKVATEDAGKQQPLIYY